MYAFVVPFYFGVSKMATFAYKEASVLRNFSWSAGSRNAVLFELNIFPHLQIARKQIA